jgi:hypothetical protein
MRPGQLRLDLEEPASWRSSSTSSAGPTAATCRQISPPMEPPAPVTSTRRPRSVARIVEGCYPSRSLNTKGEAEVPTMITSWA